MPPRPPILFGPFPVTPQVFHHTPHSFALVNLKPLLPGHVLVCPRRVVPRMHDLSAPEISDLFQTAQRVGRLVTRVYAAQALNFAVQDGQAAGQSVAHVHCHVIPRSAGDMDAAGGGDRLYALMDGDEGDVGVQFALEERRKRMGKGVGKPDAERAPRGAAEMEREAEWLAGEMDKLIAEEGGATSF